ncbi:hypothetical protein D0Y53_09995 [Luteimonas weifangensis]|uniref:Uncharacterized protein n=2 Tax=Cognatiluteimonas weifangensis TaxID=2303539 RepID=A0A372DJW5_9GAMM|nr:hypothetical protein D0Y53_09995 [Luteimonas weifangensis]
MLRAFGKEGSNMYYTDLILAGATKRTLGLGHGLISMINAKNMLCGRAIVRMQIDTVSRVLAYTYVSDREDLARRVIGGEKLRSFRCSDGKRLTDQYLIERLSKTLTWVSDTYDRTSGSVHFSEQQLFSASEMISDDNGSHINLLITQFDTKYPESSWSEIAACFSELTEFFVHILDQYSASKPGG